MLKASDVSQDVDGLNRLIAAGSFRSAVQLTSVILTEFGYGKGLMGRISCGHSPESLQVCFLIDFSHHNSSSLSVVVCTLYTSLQTASLRANQRGVALLS